MNLDEVKEKIKNSDSFYITRTLLPSIKDINLKMELLKLASDKINNQDIEYILKTINNIEDKIKIINLFQEKLNDDFLKTFMYQILDDNNKIEYINICSKNHLNIIGNLIPFIKNESEKINTTIKYYELLNSYEITSIIDSLKEQDNQTKLITISKDKLNIENILMLLEKNERINILLDVYKNDLEKTKQLNNFNRIINSNSVEIKHISNYILSLLKNIPVQRQEETINQIESIFTKDNLPMIAKIYKTFDIMHPNFKNIIYFSPNLIEEKNIIKKQDIIFSDILRCALGSNNSIFKNYINDLKNGNIILKKYYTNLDLNTLTDQEKNILKDYLDNLNALYNNTEYGRISPRKLKNDLEIDTLELLSLFLHNNENVDKLPDRIIKMFSHSIGINSIEDIEKYMDYEINKANKKNLELGKNEEVDIKKEDFVKGIGYCEEDFFNFLNIILQNGVLCKEFLKENARSDSTPLDIDLCKLLEEPKSFKEAFTNSKYAASSYGPIWIVIKDSDIFNYSQSTKEFQKDKYEVFKTERDREGHYGIRTGVPTSIIDYFVIDEEKVNFDEMKKIFMNNNFYIPIANLDGKIIFKPEMYLNEEKERTL